MALLPILHYPDPRLHTVAVPVKEVTDEIRRLLDDMLETMYEAQGVGLAATQVNVHQRIVVIDVSEKHDAPLVLINPEIVASNGEPVVGEEGCLSVPGIFDKVERAPKVTVQALGRDGQSYQLDADGLLAVCIQHEIDHLNGILFIDRLLEQRKKLYHLHEDDTWEEVEI